MLYYKSIFRDKNEFLPCKLILIFWGLPAEFFNEETMSYLFLK